jgi:hypothetical protein
MRRVFVLGIAAGFAGLAGLPAARAGEPKPIDFFFPRPPAKVDRTIQRTSNHRVVSLEDAEADRETARLPRYQTVPYTRTYSGRAVTPTTWGMRYGTGYAYPSYGAYYGSGYYGVPMAYPMYGYSYGYTYGGAPYSAHCYSRGPCGDPCPPRRSRCCLLGGLLDGLFGGCCSEPCCPPPPTCCPDPCYQPGGVIMGPPPGMPVETQSPVSPPQYAPPSPGTTDSPPTPIEKKGTAPSALRFPQLIIPDGRPS